MSARPNPEDLMPLVSPARLLAATSALLLLAGTTAAQSVDELAPIKGTVLGEVPEGGGASTIGLLLPELSTKTQVQIKLAKGSLLVPEVRIVAPDGSSSDLDDLVAAGATVKVSSKGVTIKNLPVGESGLYKVVVAGADNGSGPATAGAYSFKSKAKFSKGLKLSGQSISGTGDSNDHALHVGENSFLSVKLKLDKQLPFGVDFRILTASGTEVSWEGYEKIAKDGSISIKNLPLPFFGDYILRVASSAGDGNYSLTAKAKAKKLKVNPDAPTADAGDDGIVAPETESTLDGSATTGEDSVLWSQVSGPAVTMNDPAAVMPTFTSPAGTGTVVFQLVANNDAGNSPADVVILEVDTLPVAAAGAARFISSGETITLMGSGTDVDDGQTLTYRWRQVSGPAGGVDSPNEASTTFTPTTAGVYVFEFVVSDGIGESESDRVIVVVDGAGPAADAGRPVMVRPMDTVFLSGLRSYAADGTSPSTWSWSRVDDDDANLELENGDGPVASFGAPKQDAVLRFRLVVDGEATAADEVTVIVDRSLPENASPIPADPGESVPTLVPTNNLQLSSSGSVDDDGDTMTFEWLQVSGSDFGLD
ncbi:MAG: PKD domain-containing protein, partial [Planctomycetota bacterium]